MLSTGVSFQPLRDVFGEVSNGCCWTQDQERGQDFGRRQHRWRSGGDISARSLSRRRISAVSVCRGRVRCLFVLLSRGQGGVRSRGRAGGGTISSKWSDVASV